ncbi:hypothetical protein F1D05_10090 [Kribbella qitaiheensis]|uniref:NB-ARC domain-containing protein n=1 Tax=Kribbella qitaiheensis TaxID=1544730 RepID=A0A7G6WW15_9ACTN|nr:tetratricopeptide repeat protein [Kribbella qitaiheensis]QNE18180.1 hypothetical protein F1D05_10090 [Kribbella qitaiheensis]
MQPEDDGSRLSHAFGQSVPALNAVRFPIAARIWAVPAPVGNFVNRTEYVEIVRRLAASLRTGPCVLAIHGVSGSGKSALLDRLADGVSEHFDDAIRLSLRGFRTDSMADVLGYVLGELGIDLNDVGPDVASRHGRLLSATKDRRILMLVDDASEGSQIRLLTPNSPGAMVIAAGSIRLDDLATDGAVVKRLDGLDPEHALELLTAILGAERAKGAASAVARLVDLCSGSPLGLKTVAQHLLLRTDLSLTDLVSQLESRAGQVEPGPAIPALRRAMTAIFDSAYEFLMLDEAKIAYRALGAVPGDRWPKEVVHTVLADANIDIDAALGRLIQLDFLRPVAGGYEMPYLIGRHAEQIAARTPHGDRDQLRATVIRCWLSLAAAADRGVQRERFRVTPVTLRVGADFTSPKDAMEWLENWHDAIFEIVQEAAAQGLDTEAWQLFEACWPFHTSHNRYDEWIKAGTIAVEAAERSQNRRAVARSRSYLARGWMEQGGLGQAEVEIQRASERSSAIGDPALTASVLDFEGQLRLRQAQPDAALACFTESLRINQQLGDQRGIALQYQFCGRSLYSLGRDDEALAVLAKAWQLIQPFADHRAESKILYSTAQVLSALGRPDEAVGALTDALTRVTELGRTSLVVPLLDMLVQLAREAGDRTAEVSYLRKLQEVHTSAGDPRLADVQARLQELNGD